MLGNGSIWGLEFRMRIKTSIGYFDQQDDKVVRNIEIMTVFENNDRDSE